MRGHLKIMGKRIYPENVTGDRFSQIEIACDEYMEQCNHANEAEDIPSINMFIHFENMSEAEYACRYLALTANGQSEFL